LKVLILYTELAGYVVSCINAAAEDPRISEIHVVRYPVNNEAPFVFNFHQNVKIYDRKEFSSSELLGLAENIKPEIILCSGWIDKDYLKICKSFKKSSQTVLTMDNHWEGSMKQYLLKFISHCTIHKCFTHAWVPGKPQKEYALKLGFKLNKIQEGVYVTDTNRFTEIFEANKMNDSFPKVLICVARYIPAKGLEVLWEAFRKLKDGNKSDWQLWCVGHGSGFENRKEYDGICHLGFVQPKDLQGIMKDAGVFVLPSLFEPWGVVVQEFASAGFPLLLSDKVGSGSRFLKNEENGYSFKANDVNDLYHALIEVTSLTDVEYKTMAAKSNEIAANLTIKNWVETLVSIRLNGPV